MPNSISTKPAVGLLAGFIVAAAFLPVPAARAADDAGSPCDDDAMRLADDLPELEGAVIRDIFLSRRQIFDTSQPEEDKPLFRLANRYHILTRPSTIRSQLLFKPGDIYSRRLLKESERILRSKPYLYEPTVRPLRLDNGMVDICVTTRDAWTLKPDFSFKRTGGENETFFEIEDRNLLGTGAALSLRHSSDVERDSTSVRYSDSQVGSSRVALSVLLTDSSDGHTRFLNIDRPFFALDARRMGGIQLFDDERERPLYDLGNQVAEFGQKRRYVQLQGGWSAGVSNGWVRRWRLGAVFDDNRFEQATDPLQRGPVPVNRRFVYPFIGFELFEDKFVTTQNHDQIARTEDIYIGRRLATSLGWSAPGLGADDALLWNAQWSRGFGSPDSTMMLFNTQWSGRYENSVRNAIAHVRGRYYRRQSDSRLFFIGLSADAGSRLDLDNILPLGGNTGLRGYPLAYQNGESRAVVTIEQRYFTDWYPFRLVRIGGAVFADAGRTWGRNPAGSNSRGWLSDIGFGLRLTSPRSSSGKILHIDLAFPLNGDNTIDDVQLLIEGRRGF